MKNKSILLYGFLSAAMVFGMMPSCKKNNDGGKGSPVITRVRLISKTDTIPNVSHPVTLDSSVIYNDIAVVKFDSTVAGGRLNQQYAIIGKNLLTTISVSFNGVSVYFNPGLVTDNSIIITIPISVPYGPNNSNKLTVVTKYGSADFNFPIIQPPATITGFSQVAGSAGDTISIWGTIFDGVTKVTFDSVPATVISSTSTSIQVIVPNGITQSHIYVTTPGGTTKSTAVFGFTYLVYDDQPAAGWFAAGWSSNITDTTVHVRRGTHAFETDYTGGYGAFFFGGGTIDVTSLGLTAMKISLYGGPGTAGKLIAVQFNFNFSVKVKLPLSEGKYTDYVIPLNAVGSPTSITSIILQEFSGNAPSTIYIDDVGFIK